MEALKYVLIVIFGYFFGNISTAKILSKFKKDDITKHGSGNPGTMNMFRTFGFKLGIVTLICDAIKGALPSLVGFLMFGGDFSIKSYIGLYLGGVSSVVGHCFPVVYKFKGGKGVATMLGVFAVAEPYFAIAAFVVCFFYLLIFDYGALTSFLFITSLTIIEAYKFRSVEGGYAIIILLFFSFCLIWFVHRQNIFRLLIGKENKVNFLNKFKKAKNKNIKTVIKEKQNQRKTRKEREIG